MSLRLMVKNLSSRSEGEERPRDGAVDLLHINEPAGEFFTIPRQGDSSPQASLFFTTPTGVLHREAIAELKRRKVGPTARR